MDDFLIAFGDPSSFFDFLNQYEQPYLFVPAQHMKQLILGILSSTKHIRQLPAMLIYHDNNNEEWLLCQFDSLND